MRQYEWNWGISCRGSPGFWMAHKVPHSQEHTHTHAHSARTKRTETQTQTTTLHLKYVSWYIYVTFSLFPPRIRPGALMSRDKKWPQIVCRSPECAKTKQNKTKPASESLRARFGLYMAKVVFCLRYYSALTRLLNLKEWQPGRVGLLLHCSAEHLLARLAVSWHTDAPRL